MKKIFKKIKHKLSKKIILAIIFMFFACIFAEDNMVRVFGSRSAEDISDEIRFHIVSMKYKFHLKKVSPPNVPVVVSVSIDKYGNTTDPKIISPDTLSEMSREIILKDLETWKFVQILGGSETVASFPLYLKNRLNQ